MLTLPGFPQSIPQYIEVPPNIEAKRIISYFYAVLSYSSNPLLLKDDSKLLILPGCWQAICNNYLAGATSTIRIKERQYNPARKRCGAAGKPERYFLDEI